MSLAAKQRIDEAKAAPSAHVEDYNKKIVATTLRPECSNLPNLRQRAQQHIETNEDLGLADADIPYLAADIVRLVNSEDEANVRFAKYMITGIKGVSLRMESQHIPVHGEKLPKRLDPRSEYPSSLLDQKLPVPMLFPNVLWLPKSLRQYPTALDYAPAELPEHRVKTLALMLRKKYMTHNLEHHPWEKNKELQGLCARCPVALKGTAYERMTMARLLPELSDNDTTAVKKFQLFGGCSKCNLIGLIFKALAFAHLSMDPSYSRATMTRASLLSSADWLIDKRIAFVEFYPLIASCHGDSHRQHEIGATNERWTWEQLGAVQDELNGYDHRIRERRSLVTRGTLDDGHLPRTNFDIAIPATINGLKRRHHFTP